MPDCTERWVEGRGGVIRDGRGEVIGMVGISADITERKREEDAQRFLAEAGNVLSSSLDYQTTLKQVAHLAVTPLGGSPLADWCAVHIRDENGGVTVLALEHVDPSKVDLARELWRKYPEDPKAQQGVPEVIRTGRSEVYPDISEDLIVAAARDDEHLAILRGLGLRSAMVVPLSVGGRTLGALTFVSAVSGRRYGPEERVREQALHVQEPQQRTHRGHDALRGAGLAAPALADHESTHVGRRQRRHHRCPVLDPVGQERPDQIHVVTCRLRGDAPSSPTSPASSWPGGIGGVARARWAVTSTTPSPREMDRGPCSSATSVAKDRRPPWSPHWPGTPCGPWPCRRRNPAASWPN